MGVPGLAAEAYRIGVESRHSGADLLAGVGSCTDSNIPAPIDKLLRRDSEMVDNGKAAPLQQSAARTGGRAAAMFDQGGVGVGGGDRRGWPRAAAHGIGREAAANRKEQGRDRMAMSLSPDQQRETANDGCDCRDGGKKARKSLEGLEMAPQRVK